MAIVAVAVLSGSSGCQVLRPPKGVQPVLRDMIVTGYCRCGECCGWKRNWYGRPVYTSGPNKGKRKHVGLTASGTMAHKGTIAADLTRYTVGTIMYVEGYGYGRVEDSGGMIKGEHIDLYFLTHRQAQVWGRQRKTVKVWMHR